MVFYLVIYSRALQALRNNGIQAALFGNAVHTRTISNVVVNAHRERIWLLKHHANTLAQAHKVTGWRINVLTIKKHVSADTSRGNRVVHPVKTAQKRTFTAARRANKCKDAARINVERNVLERMCGSVIHIEVRNMHFGGWLRTWRWSFLHERRGSFLHRRR